MAKEKEYEYEYKEFIEWRPAKPKIVKKRGKAGTTLKKDLRTKKTYIVQPEERFREKDGLGFNRRHDGRVNPCQSPDDQLVADYQDGYIGDYNVDDGSEVFDD